MAWSASAARSSPPLRQRGGGGLLGPRGERGSGAGGSRGAGGGAYPRAGSRHGKSRAEGSLEMAPHASSFST